MITDDDINDIIDKLEKAFPNTNKVRGKRMNKKHFQNIVIQSKDDLEDFRAFVHCIDEYGNYWELRAYGETAGEAVTEGWKRYQEDSQDWDCYGYIIPSGGEKNT